jgi:hypothetical protein
MNQKLASMCTYLYLGIKLRTILSQEMNRLVATECIPIYLIGKLNRTEYELSYLAIKTNLVYCPILQDNGSDVLSNHSVILDCCPI